MRLPATVLSVGVLLGLSACPPAKEPEPPALEVTVSATEVLADGTATVDVTVSNASEEVSLKASRGTWQGSAQKSIKLPDGNGTATLVTCNSRNADDCAGSVTLTATAADGAYGTASVQFLPVENCSNGVDDDVNGQTDCADTGCADLACLLPNGAGTGTCTATGTCECTLGTVEICDDLQDNNCNGRIDCAETGCDGEICRLASGAPGSCVSGKCTCPDKPEVCGNDIDDDCDGAVDCDDTNCQPKGNELGGICDANGNACSPPVGGVSTCSRCSGNGGTAQTAETLCGDAKDNDCDGYLDCQDPDCAGLVCQAAGSLCTAATLTCDCPGGAFESRCDDSQDNDCDGQTDCGDSDCIQNTTCGPNGFKCDGSKKCACSGNGGQAQTKETNCSDQADNDCDGLVDCADMDCRPTAAGGFGVLCSTALQGRKCDADGNCVCPLGQVAEATCDDTKDNDCDGKVDCGDTDCEGLVCSATGKRCSAGACACPNGGTSEANCMNSLDDDCDGVADCFDPDCVGKQCNSTSTNFQCVGNPAICKDTTASYSLVLTATPGKIPANGLATAQISAVLKDSAGLAQGGKAVTFAVTNGPGSVVAAAPLTDSAGKTGTTYTSGTAEGPATVTASYDTGTSTVTGSIDVVTPKLGQIKFIKQQYNTMGVKYSSYQENNQLTFQLLDTLNAPYPPGLTVTFRHTPVGGSTLANGVCAPDGTGKMECTATAVTADDGTTKGVVSVNLLSGTVASVVSVTAEATAGGGFGTATAGNIAIIGAKASGSQISISCSPRNVPAFTDHDCTNSNHNATINCTASFADRFNNVLGVATQATLSTEAGAAGQPTFTDATGVAKNFIAVKGFRLPVDVDPQGGEYSLNYDSGCGMKVHNPRDGLATVIVSASGEEGFEDGSNSKPANGTYDLGENFVDIGEPFIDANDNGVRDANESYVDVNNNSAWDGPNGQWDGNTVIWAETRVLFSGYAALASSGSLEEISRWYDATPPPTSGPTAQPVLELTPEQIVTVPFYLADLNFNLLTTSMAYSFTMVGTAKTTVKLTTTPARPDGFGMQLRQQFCSQPSGGTCSNACESAPCYVVTSVSNFDYGNYGDVEIKASKDPESFTVRAAATLNGVSTYMQLYGSVPVP